MSTESIEEFRHEVRGWIEDTLPAELRVGNRKDLPRESRRRWISALAERGWIVPDWPVEYGGGGLDRRRAAVVKAELAAFRKLFDLSTDATAIIDHEGRYLQQNHAHEALLGYTDEDLEESRPEWSRMIHQDDLARVQAGLRDHMAGGSDVFESVHRMQRKDGEWRWMDCKVKALMDREGRLRRLVLRLATKWACPP